MTEPEIEINNEAEIGSDEPTEKASGAKMVARFVVGSSVKFVVASTITSLVPTDNRKDRIKVAIGSYVISCVVADKAKAYVCDEIDETIDFYKKVLEQVKKIEVTRLNPDDPNVVDGVVVDRY